MASTSDRTLRLLALLQRRSHWSGRELAERLEVSERTVRRDVERLRGLGYPVEATPGIDGGYRMAPGAALPPLVLDDEEGVALVVGLQQAAQHPIEGLAEASVRALAKVMQVLPRSLRGRAEDLGAATAVPGPWHDERAVARGAVLTLAQASRAGLRVTFAYVDRAGQDTDRTVDPHRLVSLGRRWYLVAYDQDRFDWRTFRLDRMAEVTATGTRFAPRPLPDDDVVAYVRRSFGPPETTTATAVVEAPAAAVTAAIGQHARVAPITPTRCEVAIEAHDPGWALFCLARCGAPFTVDLPELRDEAARWAERLAAAARPPAVP